MRKSLIYIVIVAQILFIFGLVRGLLSTHEVQKRVNDLYFQKVRLLVQKKEIEAKIESLKDDYYLEKVAREQLNLAKEGEIVVMIDDLHDGERANPQQKVSELENYEKWWNVFFGYKNNND